MRLFYLHQKNKDNIVDFGCGGVEGNAASSGKATRGVDAFALAMAALYRPHTE